VTAQPATGPLAETRVLDLSRLLPGGYCTLLMADLGADVIKVEEPGRGDYVRWMPPYAGEDSAWHLALNRGKRSVTCDLRSDGGRDLLRDLAATADVLVESFRPGVMDRLGLGYPVLREVNPRLVYAAISGYGADSPYADRAGHDINYLGYAGALSVTGDPATGPGQPGVQVGDLGGGALTALVAILAALHARAATGAGQFCDVSMTDGVLSWLSLYAGAYFATGRSPGLGSEPLNGGLACYGVYECADGRHVTVGALEPQFFSTLVHAVGAPDLVDAHLDPDRQDEIRDRLTTIFATRRRDEWVADLAKLDACVGPVNDLAEALTDPNLLARGMVADARLPDGSPYRGIGVVPRLVGTPGRAGGPAPRLGADTEALLAELGRSGQDIAVLRERGAV
jgi:alpha-methylacyl-CoA racemase